MGATPWRFKSSHPHSSKQGSAAFQRLPLFSFLVFGWDYDEAIRDYTEAIRLDPKNAKAYRNRGLAYRRLGKYDEAIRSAVALSFLH